MLVTLVTASDGDERRVVHWKNAQVVVDRAKLVSLKCDIGCSNAELAHLGAYVSPFNKEKDV